MVVFPSAWRVLLEFWRHRMGIEIRAEPVGGVVRAGAVDASVLVGRLGVPDFVARLGPLGMQM